MSWLLARRQQWAEFRALYRDLIDVLAQDFPGPVGDRYASYFAAMLVAATLASPVLGLPGDPERNIRSVMEELAQPQGESDTALKAMMDLTSWAFSCQRQFEGKADPDRPPLTYLGRWSEGQYIAVFPHEARSQLERMGYSTEATFRSWRDRGWIRVDQDRFTQRVRFRNDPQHMITLDWEAVMAAIPAQGLLLP